HAAGRWRGAAPARVAGGGDKREEGRITSEALPPAGGIEEIANFARMSWALSAGQGHHSTGRPLENVYNRLGTRRESSMLACCPVAGRHDGQRRRRRRGRRRRDRAEHRDLPG